MLNKNKFYLLHFITVFSNIFCNKTFQSTFNYLWDNNRTNKLMWLSDNRSPKDINNILRK